MKSKSAGFPCLNFLWGWQLSLSAYRQQFRLTCATCVRERSTATPSNWKQDFLTYAPSRPTENQLHIELRHQRLNNFAAPADLVEMKDHPERMECCNSDIETAGRSSGCAYGPEIGTLLAKDSSGAEKEKIIRDRSLRLLDREGTPESEVVEVSVNLASYELTPPGTSTMSDDLIFLIRSTNKQEQRLRTRCLQVSGTGTIVEPAGMPQHRAAKVNHSHSPLRT